MHKKFEINRTKSKGICQSGRKVVTHYSKSNLPLELLEELRISRIFGITIITGNFASSLFETCFFFDKGKIKMSFSNFFLFSHGQTYWLHCEQRFLEQLCTSRSSHCPVSRT